MDLCWRSCNFPTRKNMIKVIFFIGSMIAIKNFFEWQHTTASRLATRKKEVQVNLLKSSTGSDSTFHEKENFVKAKIKTQRIDGAKSLRGSIRDEVTSHQATNFSTAPDPWFHKTLDNTLEEKMRPQRTKSPGSKGDGVTSDGISSRMAKKKVSNQFRSNEESNLQQRFSEKCRKMHLQKSRNSNRLVKSLRNIIVVDEKKILFCYVPKVACTNWKRILLILKGVLNDNATVDHMTIHQTADAHLPNLSSHNVDDAMRKLREYKKVLFVREPFSRLLSAYKDKLETSGRVDSDRFRREWGSVMKNSTNRGKEISFLEYVSYLANPSHPLNHYRDEHWNPIYQLCRPCDVKYDFIGSMENLEKDTEYVLSHIVDPKLKINFHNSTNFTNSSSVDLVKQYYSQIPTQTLIQLHKKYLPDFRLFDYPFPLSALNKSSITKV